MRICSRQNPPAASSAPAEISRHNGSLSLVDTDGPGTTLRLRGKGVPVLNGRGRGDQFVTVKVAVPRNLNETQKEALRKYAETMGELAPTGTDGGGEDHSFFHKKKKK